MVKKAIEMATPQVKHVKYFQLLRGSEKIQGRCHYRNADQCQKVRVLNGSVVSKAKAVSTKERNRYKVKDTKGKRR